MLDYKFTLAIIFSLMLEHVVHESLVTGLISQDTDLEMDQKGQVLKLDIMAIKKRFEARGYVLIPGQMMTKLIWDLQLNLI